MEKYQIISLIGEGAYGIVLKARNLQTKQLVAIKKFKQTQNDQSIKKIINREIQVLKSLKHPNIVELRQAFKNKGIYYLVFQYLDNNILEILESSRKGLQRKLIIKYIYQVLSGLAFMHTNHHIHRDIKPENLLVNHEHFLRICDMGFARKLNLQQNLTDYVATRWYRSPELLFRWSYGAPADIWATGCLMAQLIDGNPLFPGEDEIDQVKKIQDFFLVDFTNCKKNFKRVQYRGGNEHFGRQNLKMKYSYKISRQGVDLLRRMIEIDPDERITALQALNHPFFDSVRQECLSKDQNGVISQSSFKWSRKISRKIRFGELNHLVNIDKTNRTQYGRFGQMFAKMEEKLKPSLKINTQRYCFGSHINKTVPTEMTIRSQKILNLRGINKIYRNKMQETNRHTPRKTSQVKVRCALDSTQLVNKSKNFRKRILK